MINEKPSRGSANAWAALGVVAETGSKTLKPATDELFAEDTAPVQFS
jgi:hypothetical protein